MTLTDDEVDAIRHAVACDRHDYGRGMAFDESEHVPDMIRAGFAAGLAAIPRDGNEPQPKWKIPEQALQYVVAMAKGRARAGLAAIPREPTFDALRAAICSDYTDEQLQHGLAQLANLRKSLGERARAETICGVVYDGMIYPIRQSLGWTNKDDAAHGGSHDPNR